MNWITGDDSQQRNPDPFAWRQHRTRRGVLVICCPNCGNTEVRRINTKGGTAYWGCLKCQTRWKERPDVGQKKARM